MTARSIVRHLVLNERLRLAYPPPTVGGMEEGVMAFVTGTACTTHGYEHMVTECSACQASKLDRLRSELATKDAQLQEALDACANAATELEKRYDLIVAKDARIAEFEAKLMDQQVVLDYHMKQHRLGGEQARRVERAMKEKIKELELTIDTLYGDSLDDRI